MVFTINRNQFKQIIKNNILLPAFIFDKSTDVVKAFGDHIDSGANIIVAGSAVFGSENVEESTQEFLKRCNP